MIKDLNELEGGSKAFSGDICIVGAGIAGITIAREFINSNKNVIILESGGLAPGGKPEELNEGKKSGFPYYNISKSRGRAFGGTSHLWHIDINKDVEGVRLRGLDSIDFEKKDWIPYSGWPFSKQDLDPYYIKAHKLFKIGPYTYDPEDWFADEKPDLLLLGSDKVNSTLFQFARKDIFYKDYRKEIEGAENIITYLHATVTQIVVSENASEVTSLTVQTIGGKTVTVKAQNYVLATGGLENACLLLLSDQVEKSGLGNKNDLVGRFFMEHPHHTRGSGIFYPSEPESQNTNRYYNIHERNGVTGLGYLTLTDDMVRTHKLTNVTIRINGQNEWRLKGLDEARNSLKAIKEGVHRMKKPDNLNNHMKVLFQNTNLIAYSAMRKFVRGDRNSWNRYPRKYSGITVGIMSEQIPDPESRLTLVREKDILGQPILNLHWKLNALDIKSIRKTLEIIDSEFRSHGLGHIEFEMPEDDEPPKQLKGGYHHMGTTRMHVNPKMGVVNEHCRLHGTNNLYIIGSSVFPTSGYANPTLTIAALSFRLADYLKKIM